jgi:hypothetical protein
MDRPNWKLGALHLNLLLLCIVAGPISFPLLWIGLSKESEEKDMGTRRGGKAGIESERLPQWGEPLNRRGSALGGAQGGVELNHVARQPGGVGTDVGMSAFGEDLLAQSATKLGQLVAESLALLLFIQSRPEPLGQLQPSPHSRGLHSEHGEQKLRIASSQLRQASLATQRTKPAQKLYPPALFPHSWSNYTTSNRTYRLSIWFAPDTVVFEQIY